MNKRKLGSIALSVMLIALGLPAEAQQVKKIPMIGYLAAGSLATMNINGLRQGLRELGYVEGKTITIEYRYG